MAVNQIFETLDARTSFCQGLIIQQSTLVVQSSQLFLAFSHGSLAHLDTPDASLGERSGRSARPIARSDKGLT